MGLGNYAMVSADRCKLEDAIAPYKTHLEG